MYTILYNIFVLRVRCVKYNILCVTRTRAVRRRPRATEGLADFILYYRTFGISLQRTGLITATVVPTAPTQTLTRTSRRLKCPADWRSTQMHTLPHVYTQKRHTVPASSFVFFTIRSLVYKW